ncbi:hypothetical protein ZIOFF_060811 [Zingiber officinale]|uniref:Uncharacterized protein n=1 Tax=Zingiber officinale TaxID=94328 RepID=A0A8J5FC51_ZINOF|nr:hypothetical protein ZIOFF_060811 [Zingiber officinale]
MACAHVTPARMLSSPPAILGLGQSCIVLLLDMAYAHATLVGMPSLPPANLGLDSAPRTASPLLGMASTHATPTGMPSLLPARLGLDNPTLFKVRGYHTPWCASTPPERGSDQTTPIAAHRHPSAHLLRRTSSCSPSARRSLRRISMATETAGAIRTTKPVTISYSEIKDKGKDLYAKIEEGFGPDGLGIISVSDVCPRLPFATSETSTMRTKLSSPLSSLSRVANLPDEVKSELEDPESSMSKAFLGQAIKLSDAELESRGLEIANLTREAEDNREVFLDPTPVVVEEALPDPAPVLIEAVPPVLANAEPVSILPVETIGDPTDASSLHPSIPISLEAITLTSLMRGDLGAIPIGIGISLGLETLGDFQLDLTLAGPVAKRWVDGEAAITGLSYRNLVDNLLNTGADHMSGLVVFSQQPPELCQVKELESRKKCQRKEIKKLKAMVAKNKPNLGRLQRRSSKVLAEDQLCELESARNEAEDTLARIENELRAALAFAQQEAKYGQVLAEARLRELETTCSEAKTNQAENKTLKVSKVELQAIFKAQGDQLISLTTELQEFYAGEKERGWRLEATIRVWPPVL